MRQMLDPLCTGEECSADIDFTGWSSDYKGLVAPSEDLSSDPFSPSNDLQPRWKWRKPLDQEYIDVIQRCCFLGKDNRVGEFYLRRSTCLFYWTLGDAIADRGGQSASSGLDSLVALLVSPIN